MSPSRAKLSVIVPVYNVRPYVDRCLDSILSQHYENLEIICVDDGSTDGSGLILDNYSLRDSRIKVIHKENGGLVSARKTGLQAATGECATYVDSDDWIEPGMYHYMMEKMCTYPIDLVTSGIIRDYGSHVVLDPEQLAGVYTGDALQNAIKENLVDFAHPFHFTISASLVNKIFKTEMLKAFQLPIPDEVTIDEDTVCAYPYIMHCNGVYVMQECYYHYCQRADSLMLNLEVPDAFQLDAIRIAYAHARKWLPSRLADYMETYALLGVCPEQVVQYENGELYPFGQVAPNSKVVVYGAGGCGRHIKKFLEEKTDIHVVAWVDKSGDGIAVLRQEQLPPIDYDCILVCVALGDIVEDICKDFETMGIDMRKVRCIHNVRMRDSDDAQQMR